MADASGRAPVLFLHALAGNAAQWRAQIEHLMPERMALAVDLPGHGVSGPAERSDYAPPAVATEIAAIIDALELAPLVLVGHSYGAAVAIAVLARRPEVVTGVLLVDPGPDLRREPEDEIAAFLETMAPDSYEVAITGHYEGALAGGRVDVREEVLKSLSETPREVVVSALESLAAFDPVTPLQAFRGPKLSVFARQHDGPNALHRVLPELPGQALSGVSHWLHMDAPDRFNAILDEFLAEADLA